MWYYKILNDETRSPHLRKPSSSEQVYKNPILVLGFTLGLLWYKLHILSLNCWRTGRLVLLYLHPTELSVSRGIFIERRNQNTCGDELPISTDISIALLGSLTTSNYAYTSGFLELAIKFKHQNRPSSNLLIKLTL